MLKFGNKKKFNLQATDDKRTFVDDTFGKNCFALIDSYNKHKRKYSIKCLINTLKNNRLWK